MGTLAVAGYGLAVKAAAGFEEKLSHFKAVSDSTQAEMDQIREKALQLGRDSAYGAEEVAGAFTELAKAGVSANDIINGVGDAVVTLAAAADVPIAQASDNLINIMKTFSLTSDQAVHVADILAGAANASTIEIDDLATSMKYAGSVAATLHIPLESVAAALAILGNNGIKGSTGGTSLRRMLLNLTPVSVKASKMMLALGIITGDGANAFFDATGKAKDLAGISQVLQDHLKGLSDEERIHALNVMFGNRAVSSAAILAREGAAGFKAMSDQISQTTALEVMNTRLDNLSGALRIFKSSIETAFIRTGTAAQKPATEFVRTLTGWVNAFAKLSPQTQEMIARIVLYTGTTLIALGATLKIVAAVLKMYSTFKQLMGIIKVARAMMMSFNLVLAANPIFLIIAAVAALGVALFLLYKKNKAFRDFIDGLWQSIQVAWDAILNFFKGLGKWFSDRWDEVAGAFKAGVDLVKKNWDLILPVIAGPIGLAILIWRRFGDDIKKFFGDLDDNIKSGLSGIGRGIMSGLSSVGRFFSNLGGWIMDFVNYMNSLPGKILRVFVRLATKIPELLGAIPHAIAYALGYALGTAIKWGILFVLAIYTAATKTAQFFLDLPGKILRAITALGPMVVNFFVSLWNMTYRITLTAWDATISWFAQLPVRIMNALIALMALMVSFFTSLWDTVYQATIVAWDATVSWLGQLPGRIANAIVALWAMTVNFFASLWEAVKSATITGVDATINFFAQLPARIWGAISSLAASVAGWFAHISVSMVDAVKNHIDEVVNFFTQLPGRIWDAIKNLAGSVFNWFKGIGESLWHGFRDAIMGSPKTKVEYTLLDMVDTTEGVVRDMNAQMRKLEEVIGPTLPLPGLTAAGMSSPAQVAARLGATGGSNAPVPAAGGGDHYEFHQVMADPVEISEAITWKKRTKSRLG